MQDASRMRWTMSDVWSARSIEDTVLEVPLLLVSRGLSTSKSEGMHKESCGPDMTRYHMTG